MNLLFREMDEHEESLRKICTSCKKRLAPPGKRTCEQCKEWSKISHNNTLKKGLCIRCNKQNKNGKKVCDECSTKSIKLRRQNKAAGLCMRCDKPIKEGYSECEEHHQARIERRKRYRVEKWSLHLISKIRKTTRNQGYEPSDITEEEVIELFENQCGRCYWTGIPMIPSEEKHPFMITPDRIDCSRGYIRGNVVLATYFANCGRGDYPADKFWELCEPIRNMYIKDTVIPAAGQAP